MKANHNCSKLLRAIPEVVLYNTKILKMKANHNFFNAICVSALVVLYNTKILKMKANHNLKLQDKKAMVLFFTTQRY